ncbi:MULTISPECIES: alpha/beta fold hydrolase [Streptomyces]|uniref:Alpha/beta hydrolase n=1 Tax=Streptomyces caniscabiei TaxID=2746961 RepID=A0ABU4N2U4_9ACTN|nr:MULTISPECIES: alpha/beta hydrolase [Streptomyces]MBE4741344.1 alpha/beta hydrolase [Streptomyces caniscabiei]MBE4761503.1 alpha/beta hydrolase [Streptomyces caniscabiei]MBE4775499.1 alpha/beta hydrolase [Streptomyces caniscabiei]MBE4789828.1 alpha/beta hydrolase [Streptomyces caniscabiei]MBE4799152.1 alpha/beta hydrolase [Streptomyces caniscabiei]
MRRHHRPLILGVAVTVGMLTATVVPSAAAPATERTSPKPTVVLVHGAFADASGWSGVVSRLKKAGYPVVAPANPLRGLQPDAAYLASLLGTIDGPKIVVGHSYGGAVVTEAAASVPEVKALVYVAAFMPDKGEVLGELANRFPGSELLPALEGLPDGAGHTDVAIKPDKFHDVFAGDLPRSQTSVLAVSQRPVSLSAFESTAQAAAWRTIPSWFMVATGDKTISPALERFQAKRAGSHTVEVNSSHVVMMSHPDKVTALIKSAAKSTR